MRKSLDRKLLFFLATIFTCLGVTAGSYGRSTIYVSSPQDKLLAVGEQMHLNIRIAGGRNVSGYELTVGFDPTVLRYIDGENANYLPAPVFVVPPIVSESTVYMAATSTVSAASVSEGTLATLTFEIVAAKDSTIKLMDVILSNSAAIPLAVITRNGQIVATELPTIWDVNEDRKVNILDLTLAARNLMVVDLINPRVDVNRDSVVNILDLVLIAQHLDAARGKKDKPEVKIRLVEVFLTPPANFVSAAPPSGSTIAANASITLTFDNAPADVTVNPGAAAPSGKTVTVNGPFTPGPLSLTITWADGTRTLIYSVTAPDSDPPAVTGVINTDGKIEITFSEDVFGNVALQTKGGDDVGWIGKVAGNKATLEVVKGKEISNETAYVIRGRVLDGAGNRTDVEIVIGTTDVLQPTTTPPLTHVPVPLGQPAEVEVSPVVEEPVVVKAPGVSFKDDIRPILAERCAIPGCHAAPGAAGLNLTQYDTFKKGGNGGAAFDGGNGKGSLVVKRIDRGGMPPIPPPLNADQIQLFIDWIDEGAENN